MLFRYSFPIIGLLFTAGALSLSGKGEAADTNTNAASILSIKTDCALSADRHEGRTPLYASADSLAVVGLLADTSLQSPLDFARQLKDQPYEAATLEVADPERLVVNLRGLDCATLVETSLALTLTRRNGEHTFSAYCRNLEKLRYFDGLNKGYLSRLHYLSFWMADHIRRGTIEEVVLPFRLTRPLTVDLHYMSRHAADYPMLRAHATRVKSIAMLEKKYSGNVGRFLPKEHVALSRRELGMIRDGDVIAVVTRKKGLDYAHQGLAFWGNDEQLHMLHASSQFKRVIEDHRPLSDYLAGISHARGIRVFRLR